MVATPARPETTTTDTINPLDNEFEGDAPEGDSANLDAPNIPGASSRPTSARVDESARINEGTRLNESARIDERARVDERASVDERARGGLAETQPQAQQMRGGGRDRPCRVKKPVSKFA